MIVTLFFLAFVISLVLVVFFGETFSSESPAPKVFWVLGVVAVVVLCVFAGFKATYNPPFVGKATVLSVDEQEPYRVRSGKITRTVSKCYLLVVEPVLENRRKDVPGDWIRSVCIPMKQWVGVEVGDVVELGYDEHMNPKWGHYIIGGK